MHSSGTGLAEPDPDASYVAIAMARRTPPPEVKAIVRAVAAGSQAGNPERVAPLSPDDSFELESATMLRAVG